MVRMQCVYLPALFARYGSRLSGFLSILTLETLHQLEQSNYVSPVLDISSSHPAGRGGGTVTGVIDRIRLLAPTMDKEYSRRLDCQHPPQTRNIVHGQTVNSHHRQGIQQPVKGRHFSPKYTIFFGWGYSTHNVLYSCTLSVLKLTVHYNPMIS